MSAALILQTCATLPARLDEEYRDCENLSPETLAVFLVAFDDAIGELRALRKIIEQDLIHTAGEKRFVVEHLGEIEIKKKLKRTAWRYDEMVPAVVARIMDEREVLFDRETGELLPYAVIGQNVASRLRDCIGFSAGKVTGLRAIGLEPDEFCTEEPDGYSTRITRSGK